jgi:hypothetical protein
MIFKRYILLMLLLAMVQTGCFGDKNTERLPEPIDPILMQEAKALLTREGVNAESLESKGWDISIVYETSNADEYDDQLLVVWATIFGTLWRYTDETVTIVNTIDDERRMVIKADREDIRLFAAGVLKSDEFFSRATIKSIEPAE